MDKFDKNLQIYRVDTYESNDGTLYCKPHFKALFAPKAVEEDASRKLFWWFE